MNEIEQVARAIKDAWSAHGDVPFPLYDEEATNIATAAITAYRAALEAQGMVVVPKYANDAMQDAARDWSFKKYGKPIGFDASDGCYRAMITAALRE